MWQFAVWIDDEAQGREPTIEDARWITNQIGAKLIESDCDPDSYLWHAEFPWLNSDAWDFDLEFTIRRDEEVIGLRIEAG